MASQPIQHEISFNDNEYAKVLFGDLNKNLESLEKITDSTIHTRGTTLTLTGSSHEIDLIVNLLQQLYDLVSLGYPVYTSDFAFGLKTLEASPKAALAKIFLDKVYITTKNKIISPKTINQKKYIDAIRDNDIVFGLGPAGTGKTYLAVAMGVSALASKKVRSIILTRPAVEAGERLGFLPGDLQQKVHPYLRPLHDALNDMLGPEKVNSLIDQEILEIAPLAFMRGRTLSNAFVILDEAQNTTREQMKMFLTRIGFDSQAVITGDTTQIDLPSKNTSGLLHARKILTKINGLKFCSFSKSDVVRHPLVQKIIQAYEKQ